MVQNKPVSNLEDYVDIEDALARVCGNKHIYKMLLGSFQKSLQLDQLCEEAERSDFEAAAQTAHSIKGVTANLSLKAAYQKVVEVEAQLKQGSIEQDTLQEFCEIIKTTVQCTEYVAQTL